MRHSGNTKNTNKTQKVEIVLVEDNLDFAKQLNSFLKEFAEFNASSHFLSCESALKSQTIKSAKVLLLDVQLPGICGLDAIPLFLKQNPELKIIILTTFNHDDKLFTALREGAHGYILKTDCFTLLENAIAQVLAGGMLFSPEMATKVLQFFKRKPLAKTKITKREKEVLKQLKNGLSKKQISEELQISYNTVDSHLKNIYKKLHVNTNVQAVGKATESGII